MKISEDSFIDKNALKPINIKDNSFKKCRTINSNFSLKRFNQKKKTKISIDDIEKLSLPFDINENKKEVILNEKNEEGESDNIIIEISSVSLKSMISTFIQICNCIIRYTVLEIPKCFYYLGLIYGTIFIIIISLMSNISIYFLMKAHQKTGDK